MKTHGYWLSTHIKDPSAVQSSHQAPMAHTEQLQIPLTTLFWRLPLLQGQNSSEFPPATLQPLHLTGSFSTGTQTPDPHPQSKGNGSTNTFSRGLTEHQRQNKEFPLHFLSYKTAPNMRPTLMPRSPEPNTALTALLSNKSLCPRATAASSAWKSQQDTDIVLLRSLRQHKTCVDPDILP